MIDHFVYFILDILVIDKNIYLYIGIKITVCARTMTNRIQEYCQQSQIFTDNSTIEDQSGQLSFPQV